MSIFNEVDEALKKYKKENFTRVSCCNCGTEDTLGYDNISHEIYCWDCLKNELLLDEESLLDSMED